MGYNALILFFNDPNQDNIFIDNMNLKDGVRAACILKNVSLPLRMLRRVHLISGLPGIQCWFTDWDANLCQYSSIICIATKYSQRILKWIARKTRRTHNKKQLIHYYWDEIHISGYPVSYSKYYSNWSFCYDNSVEFKMGYNPQFWISTMDLKSDCIEYDVSYVGGDREGQYKERTILVNQLFQLLMREGINCFFWYITESDCIDPRIKKNVGLPQDEFLDTIKKSRVIIELVEEDNPWITQRTLYALSNEKKLITNNLKIINEPLYCKENIFVIGHDNIDDLSDFITNPYEKSGNDRIAYYEMERWIGRFMEDSV